MFSSTCPDFKTDCRDVSEKCCGCLLRICACSLEGELLHHRHQLPWPSYCQAWQKWGSHCSRNRSTTNLFTSFEACQKSSYSTLSWTQTCMWIKFVSSKKLCQSMEMMKQTFSQSDVKCLMLQLLDGVKNLHDNWVLHRNLKTSNIPLNNHENDFAIAVMVNKMSLRGVTRSIMQLVSSELNVPLLEEFSQSGQKGPDMQLSSVGQLF